MKQQCCASSEASLQKLLGETHPTPHCRSTSHDHNIMIKSPDNANSAAHSKLQGCLGCNTNAKDLLGLRGFFRAIAKCSQSKQRHSAQQKDSHLPRCRTSMPPSGCWRCTPCRIRICTHTRARVLLLSSAMPVHRSHQRRAAAFAAAGFRPCIDIHKVCVLPTITGWVRTLLPLVCL